MSDFKMKFSASGIFTAALVALVLVFAGSANAQSSDCVVDRNNNTVCPPAKSVCLKESVSGIVKCSPPDGGVIADRYGAALCGPGRCVIDIRGDAFCAKDSGGSAAKGQYGDAVCTGGCVRAQASLCTTLTR
ncbi:MAG: hypothetical protein WBK51_09905 [Polaromonas sp.]